MIDQPHENIIAYFEDGEYQDPPPYAQITSSIEFGVIVLIARTAGDEGEAGVTAPVVFNRREFAQFIGETLANADPALRAEIEIAAGNITAKRRG